MRKRLNLRIRRKDESGKGTHKLPEQLLHCLTMIKHPVEGFADLRYGNKGSYLSAAILLGLSAAALLYRLLHTHFPFTGDMPVHEVKPGLVLLRYFVFWLSWVVCNYLISSICRGEGRFSDVWIGSAYALTPFVMLAGPVSAVSNVLTLAEGSIYYFLEWFMYAWAGLMMFWMIMSVQNYTVVETVVNIFLSVAAVIVLWIVAFIIFGLSSEFMNFLYSVYQEAHMR